jgi:hypothetical protein
MQHITGFPDPNTHILSVEDTVAPMPGFVFANNLVESPRAPTQSAGGGSTNCAASDVPITVIQTCFPGYVVGGNVLVGDFTKYLTTQWPSGQTFLASFDQVGFVDYASGNYALSSSSPYKGKGTDGKDVGADIAGLNTAIGGVQ